MLETIAPVLASLDTYRAAEERRVHSDLALMLALGMATPEELEARLAAALARNLGGDLNDVVIRRDPFWQPLSRRRRRRLRGGKTQSPRPTFVPWYPTGPMKIVRGQA